MRNRENFEVLNLNWELRIWIRIWTMNTLEDLRLCNSLTGSEWRWTEDDRWLLFLNDDPTTIYITTTTVRTRTGLRESDSSFMNESRVGEKDWSCGLFFVIEELLTLNWNCNVKSSWNLGKNWNFGKIDSETAIRIWLFYKLSLSLVLKLQFANLKRKFWNWNCLKKEIRKVKKYGKGNYFWEAESWKIGKQPQLNNPGEYSQRPSWLFGLCVVGW